MVAKRDSALEAQALSALFKSIVADLSLCLAKFPHKCKKDPAYSSYSSDIAAAHSSDPQLVRDVIRQRQEQILNGLINKTVRARLVERFFSSYVSLRPSAFLASVLDGTFEELQVAVTYTGHVFDMDVIPTIAKYSPSVRILEIRFSHRKCMTQESIRSFLKSFEHLAELTELTLRYAPREFDGEVSMLGASCPKLEVLRLGSQAPLPADLFRDIVTPHHDKLGQLFHSPLPDMRVPETFLNPICRTLKYLEFSDVSVLDEFPHRHLKLLHDIAFILSNVPNLEYLKLAHLAVSEAIHLLWKDASHKGPLKLKELLKLNLIDNAPLKAISELCPCLETINFVNEHDVIVTWQGSVIDCRPALPRDILDGLARLTKVRMILFDDVNSRNAASVIQLWTNQLTILKISGNVQIPLNVLAACVNLTEFSCGEKSQLQLPPSFDVYQPFLTKLVKISISCCLLNSNLVEQLLLFSKPSLRHVELMCCHLADTPGGWETVFRQWNGVEKLQMEWAGGLDPSLIKKIPNWMPSLKSLSLPVSMWREDVSLGERVQVEFMSYRVFKVCLKRPTPPYLRREDVANGSESSDEDGNDDDEDEFSDYDGDDVDHSDFDSDGDSEFEDE